MVKNNLIIIINERGKYLSEPIGTLRANANNSGGITFVSPFPLENVVSATFKKRNGIDTEITQFLIPDGKLKGKDILDETNPLRQTIYNWNVWECDLDSLALAYVAKYRAGLLFMSFAIEEQQLPHDATNYKGRFSDSNLLPETAVNGDYYICDTYNLNDKEIVWTLNDYAYYKNGWKKSNYKGTLTTSTVEVPVDPNIKANVEIESDLDLAVLLAGRVAVLEQEVDNLYNTKQDNLIAGENITITGNVISATGGSSGGDYEPDNITIGLNEENKLEVKDNLEIDGGFL